MATPASRPQTPLNHIFCNNRSSRLQTSAPADQVRSGQVRSGIKVLTGATVVAAAAVALRRQGAAGGGVGGTF